jgi:hypothetical protein
MLPFSFVALFAFAAKPRTATTALDQDFMPES